MTDEVLRDYQARIRAAVADKMPLVIRGGGTKDFYGESPSGRLLDATRHSGIVDYDPTELVITARAGTRLDEVLRTLRASGQMLPCEPPGFGVDATLGGAVAAGLSGPRRPYTGAMRDIVLGVRVIDGRGEELAFGGRVMKNVAGFDLSRLMTGALGTLGLLTEISLRCLPLPKAETTRVLECGVDNAIGIMGEWNGRPLPVSATCHRAGLLAVRLSGAAPAVEAASKELGGTEMPASDVFWEDIREQTSEFFAAARAMGMPLWRLSVKGSAPYADLGGEQLIEWSGALRWLAADKRADPARIRDFARDHGGHATLFRAADKSAGVFQPLPETLFALHRRLKAIFDPSDILNRGRLYADL